MVILMGKDEYNREYHRLTNFSRVRTSDFHYDLCVMKQNEKSPDYVRWCS